MKNKKKQKYFSFNFQCLLIFFDFSKSFTLFPVGFSTISYDCDQMNIDKETRQNFVFAGH